MNEQQFQCSRNFKWSWPIHPGKHLRSSNNEWYPSSLHANFNATVNTYFTFDGLCKKSNA